MADRQHRTRAIAEIQGLVARASEAYKRALIGYQSGLSWDYLVLTAANRHQAAGYQHEFDLRASGVGPMGSFFPASQKTLVVPDPPGFRAGSGGATFGAIAAIARHQKTIGDTRGLDSLRILLIHSGGASQRLPQFSPLGKIFAPLPMIRPDGQLMTIFDHLYLMVAALPQRLGPGLLVAAGDVFLLFDAGSMPQPPAGITALSMRAPAELGRQHGVFVAASNTPPQADSGRREVFPLVAATLQKATLGQMRRAGATDENDRVLIDSGLLFFDAKATLSLQKLSWRYTPAWHLKTRHRIDLYADIVPAALAGKPARSASGGPLRQLAIDLQEALTESPLRCHELPHAHFQHLGTTLQFRNAMTGLDQAPACGLFAHNVRVASQSSIPPSARVYQSVITTPAVRIGSHVLIENSLLAAPLRIASGCVLSNVNIATAAAPLRIPSDTVIFSVPVIDAGRRFTVSVICGIHDDPKTSDRFCNINLPEWLRQAKLLPNDIWPNPHTESILWNAKLFTGSSRLGDIDHILWCIRPHALKQSQRKAWRKARRYSMADILELADPAALAEHRDKISGILQGLQWVDAVGTRTAASVQNGIHHFGPAGYEQLLNLVYAAADNKAIPLLQRARLHWSLAEIIDRPVFPRRLVKIPATTTTLRREAFNNIRDALELARSAPSRKPWSQPSQSTQICSQHPLAATAPVRLDLAGGWTDTPPFCLDHGGSVVNVAVNLNDAAPIESSFRPVPDCRVRLVARDLGQTLEISDLALLHRPLDPRDPLALQIAALRLVGLTPRPAENSLKKWLARVSSNGQGFELTTASNLPKGSGMGTSSILGATTLAVLRAAMGLPYDQATLFEQTLLLEQLLGTGGGWQDQVGGIVGGVKIARTKPGLTQSIHVNKIPLSARQLHALQERLVVYFTGQQRLARNILRQVMGRYLSREPGTMVLFSELMQCSRACAAALQEGDWLACAAEINRYWRIKKDLYAGSTTPAVDELFLALRPYYLAGGLSGAGGGGFAYFLCADADQAHRLRSELARMSARPGSMGLIFAATINTRGLRVHTNQPDKSRQGTGLLRVHGAVSS